MAVSINVHGATFILLGQPGRHSVEQDLSVIKTLYEALLNVWTQGWDTKVQSSINKILYETLVMNDNDTSFRDECPSHNGNNNMLSLQINWGSTS